MSNKKYYMYESNQPTTFEDVTQGKSGAILGKLHAPFFDLVNPTRNGRDYTEAAEDSLESDIFKEKIATRTFFGRLGHPVTDEEMAEDPAVRACVVMTDYEKNPKTNMYEGTWEILNNSYGRQLKSLIDAGCVMGVSTRGSGDSKMDSYGNEVIKKGTYDFEAVDIVSLPAVKEARCTVVESMDGKERKSIRECIEESNDKVMLEQLKVTVEASEFKDKQELLESINKKLNENIKNNDAETIESLIKDIGKLSEKAVESDKTISDLKTQLESLMKEKAEDNKSETGTTEVDEKFEAFKAKYTNLFSEALKAMETLKVNYRESIKAEKELTEKLNVSTKANESINRNMSILKGRYSKLQENYAKLESDNKSINEELSKVKLENAKVITESKSDTTETKKLTEDMNKLAIDNKKLKESVTQYSNKVKELGTKNANLTNAYNDLKSGYVESIAHSNGISYNDLKSRVTENMNKNEIDKIVEAMVSEKDRRNRALPKLESVVGQVISADKIRANDYDDELERAARIAQMTH